MTNSHGIHVIDTGFVRPHLDAAYLIVEKGRGAFIDCGVNHSVPRLLAALADAGLAPGDVDWLILTHVHLDHAGGAGALMQQLPNARLVVHPRGARHMIDPSRLWAGATAVYGEAEMQRSYGQLVPVAAERVVEAPDGHAVELAGRRLVCLDTPGHARHHNAIHDPASGCVFSGDTFGVSYREFDTAQGPFIVPATSPSELDPPALHRSIDRLVALQPGAIYPTHFGRLEPVQRLAAQLHEQIDAMVANGETYLPSGLIWGWRLLSKQAPYEEAAGYDEPVNGQIVRKVLVLMTDGKNTLSPTYPTHVGTDTAKSDQITAELCSNIKAKGIEIYTVAFQVPDADSKTVLESCASSASKYFDAVSTAELETAFRRIGMDFNPMRITR